MKTYFPAPILDTALKPDSKSARIAGCEAVIPAGSLITVTSGTSDPPEPYFAMMAESAMSLLVPGMSKLMLQSTMN